MFKKQLPIGIENFQEIIKNDYYYVDKTLLIKELLDTGSKALLLTRPSGFGKTLALSMIQTFFEDVRDKNGEKIHTIHYFKEKKIMDAGEEYISYAGKYPVISLSLKNAMQSDFDATYSCITDILAKEFQRHSYILASEFFSETEQNYYNMIMKQEASYPHYATAIETLSRYLHRYHKKPAIILIDDYDTPLKTALSYGFYHKMIYFIRSLLESALKTNSHLNFAIVTGFLNIGNESISCGLNNLNTISIFNKNYSNYFGFTQKETEELLDFYDLEHDKDIVWKWYGGYSFGGKEFFNPYSVIHYIADSLKDTNKPPKAYGLNTSASNMLYKFIKHADVHSLCEIKDLLNGKTVAKSLHEELTYDTVFDLQDNLWNLLLFAGYLTTGREWQDICTIYSAMSIPNEEIAYIYKNCILPYLDKKQKTF